ncbi:MAG: nucleoside kinase, partial [Clostridiales bacterium]|nr:nucleoside kinase [Clostridiales bacterium]MDY4112004.1 nucleoside kinase [Roseburia sp.]
MGDNKMVTLSIAGEEKQYAYGTSFLAIAQEYQERYNDDIVLVVYNNRLRELGKVAEKDGTLEFVTTADKTGKKTYRRSVTLLMQKAVHNLWGAEQIAVRVKYSIGQGYYCELWRKSEEGEARISVNEAKVSDLKREMYHLVMADIEIEKRSMNTDDAIALFHGLGMTDKEKLFRYRRSSRVNIYVLDHYKDYFYGFMVPSTGYLRYYDVTPYEDGFVLLFPD